MKSWLLLCISIFALPHLSLAAQPVLTKPRVFRLATTAAKHAGYDLHRFERPTFSFIASDCSPFWFVRYEGKPDKNGMTTIGNFFSVRVSDHDGRATISPGY